MRWKKLGLVYCPTGEKDWAQSHAYVPTTIMRGEDCIRVYFAACDKQKIGRIGYVDVDAKNPTLVLGVSEAPVLDIGLPGTFDDNGVTPTCIVQRDDELWLYYIGWQLGVRVRYYLFLGLAVSADGGATFRRALNVPVRDRSDGETVVRSAATIMSDGTKWNMWYVSATNWIKLDNRMVPTYHLRFLQSPDGIVWGNSGTPCLELGNKDEYGFGRPFVLGNDGQYQMWYSIRSVSKGYRLGYAESADGLHWIRKDGQVGIDVSPTGWDSEMVCFACVQPTRHGTYMFYNGNNYGETGFGVAVLED